jgi:16S rRNA (adenine1518-N6/adenine1519-N6)-dimethyltransferase
MGSAPAGCRVGLTSTSSVPSADGRPGGRARPLVPPVDVPGRERRGGPHRRGRRRPPPPPELRAAGLRARKSLAQHFLVDQRILARVVAAADISPDETIVEVGAGLGVLTVELATRARVVAAVEVDEKLCLHLRQRLQPYRNVAVVCADILTLSPQQLLEEAGGSGPYAVVANLPYYVAAPVLRHFLEADQPPTRLVVMLQSEVAESIAAGPGGMSLLGVSVQFYGRPRLLFRVPPEAFYPPPKVRSAVLRIDVDDGPRVAVPSRDAFFEVVRAGFSAPRKQLRNSLAQGLGISPGEAAALLAAAAIDPRQRPQELSVEEWAALCRARPQAAGG